MTTPQAGFETIHLGPEEPVAATNASEEGPGIAQDLVGAGKVANHPDRVR